MTLARAVLRYRLPLARPISVRRGAMHVTIQERHGLVLALRDESGAIGLGECSPLPGTDEAELDALEAHLLATGRSRTPLPASVAFALDMAAVHLQAARENRSAVSILAERAGTTPAQRVPIQGVFVGNLDEARAVARSGRLAAYTHVKVKVGATSVEDDAARIEALLDGLPAATMLRLDANQGFTADAVLALLARIDTSRIAYIEEPVPSAQLADVGPTLPVPVALDESLRDAPPALLEAPFVSTWILKPMLGHALPGMDRAEEARRRGKAVVISSAIESGLGLGFLAALAGRDAACMQAAGIATDTWLAEDLIEPAFTTARGAVDLEGPPPQLRSELQDSLVWQPTPGRRPSQPRHPAMRWFPSWEDAHPLLLHEGGGTLTRSEAWRRAQQLPNTSPVRSLEGADVENVAVALLGAWHHGRLLHIRPPGAPSPTATELEALPPEARTAGTLLHTSGTTHAPKRIVHTAEAHVRAAHRAGLRLGITRESRYLASLALHHVGGLAILMRALVHGATVAVPTDRSDLAPALRALAPTYVSLVPTQLEHLLDAHGPEVLDGVQAVVVGGAPLSLATRARCVALGVPLVMTYGSTESAAFVAAGRDKDALVREGYAGRPLDPESVVVDAGGEVVLRGDTLALGRLDEAGWQPLRRDDNGYATGDLGRLHGGDLYILGRADRMFISGGENVHPERIEGALLALPAVAEAAVVALPDAKWGERPVAFLGFRPGMAADGAALRAHLASRLPRFAVPDRFYALPDDQRGRAKPDFTALRRLAEAGQLPAL